jgi:hypothetical protein
MYNINKIVCMQHINKLTIKDNTNTEYEFSESQSISILNRKLETTFKIFYRLIIFRHFQF